MKTADYKLGSCSWKYDSWRGLIYPDSEAINYLQGMGNHHVFLHGYYMPSIFDLYKKFHHLLDELTVIRMHGPDRKDIERLTGKNWNKIVAPKDQDVTDLASMLMELRSREMKTFTFINNHFEGSAPKTIQRLNRQLQEI